MTAESSAHAGTRLVDQGQAEVVRPQGELDVATAPVFRQSLIEAIDGTADKVIVDMSDVSFIDSTGIGVLVGALKRARASGVDLVVASPSSSMRKVFEITGLDHVLDVSAAAS